MQSIGDDVLMIFAGKLTHTGHIPQRFTAKIVLQLLVFSMKVLFALALHLVPHILPEIITYLEFSFLIL